MHLPIIDRVDVAGLARPVPQSELRAALLQGEALHREFRPNLPDDYVIRVADGVGLTFVWLSRIATVYYFAFFLVILPLLGVVEKPLPVPDTISSPVLSHPATHADGVVAPAKV